MLIHYSQIKAAKGNNIKKGKIWDIIVSKHQEKYEGRNKKAIQVSIL
jgi:hypothetical protein